ncbi:HlyD family efflux transporter periplasmic adaptor subunit [Streptomyces sp. NPDC049585]|uniref:HlyD family efflux transporter periplasmic adaptor subunit n=1 Tax=Streptomyces sp. NPDC049585 TaxID=3155154 RepID=UPI0034326FD4
MQFRQKALSKLQSPEELDLPVRFARPQGRLVLAVTLAVLAAGCCWALTGTVPATLGASGVLTHAEGSYLLQSPYAGQVTAVLAREGQQLTPGAPLLTLTTDRGEKTVRAVAAGRVTTLRTRIGSVLATGADVATVEKVTDPAEAPVAVLYLPGADSAGIAAGAPVDLTVPTAAARYGVLRGHVAQVGRTPLTPEQITGFLGDTRLAAQFARQGDPVAVVVRLDRAATPSGYRWSRAGGPPDAPRTTTAVTAAVHLADRRPVDCLLP